MTKIYEEVFGEELVMNKEINEHRAKDHQLLEEICREQGVPVELAEQLLQIEKDKSGLMRRNNQGFPIKLENKAANRYF